MRATFLKFFKRHRHVMCAGPQNDLALIMITRLKWSGACFAGSAIPRSAWLKKTKTYCAVSSNIWREYEVAEGYGADARFGHTRRLVIHCDFRHRHADLRESGPLHRGQRFHARIHALRVAGSGGDVARPGAHRPRAGEEGHGLRARCRHEDCGPRHGILLESGFGRHLPRGPREEPSASL